MMKTIISTLLFAEAAIAFPWVSEIHGVDSSMLQRRQQDPEGAASVAQCPFNANHEPAVAYNPKFPYNNARDGKKGDGRGGFRVPAVGDDAHRYIAPTSRDIRGPCPGLNVAANHGFLARDGVSTYAELVDACQNVYNVGYDLANVLALIALQADGDLITQKISIGCDATTRTSISPILTGSQPGLNGHNKFEQDASLTRNDFFTHNGDNFRFNSTLFEMMTETTGGNFDLEGLALYRKQRYDQSKRDNPNFYFGPLSILLYGAASFLYELFPSGTRGYRPDLETMTAFFVEEKFPDNWTNRVVPYTTALASQEILKMYLLHPVVFGGNTGTGSFNAIPSFGAIQDGNISSAITVQQTTCLIYQLAFGSVPSSLNGVVTPTVEALAFAATKLGVDFDNLGCPIALT
ncbi:uncharacterized protein RCC_08073 [Ramularia collo-cygni]|uniref:Heme haloperoxidase family profile domain-containing protein n=1 Tax=Ramularia collo-cygni TaxID=112498 RepID=A0A2D3VGY6_9PEZI|nr:uncharacterized protein RCC_08073 [Ramularia collo-cygni]CZT22204.1 uncharacterized protein RCC_08073 [Ramularia collo-cygni]